MLNVGPITADIALHCGTAAVPEITACIVGQERLCFITDELKWNIFTSHETYCKMFTSD